MLVALIVAGLWPQPAPVETIRATIGALRVTVNEEGKTRIKNRYLVSAPVTGMLRRIPLKVGDEVHAGATVLASTKLERCRPDIRRAANAADRRPSPAAIPPPRTWKKHALPTFLRRTS